LWEEEQQREIKVEGRCLREITQEKECLSSGQKMGHLGQAMESDLLGKWKRDLGRRLSRDDPRWCRDHERERPVHPPCTYV